MKVKDLINGLQKVDQNAEVVLECWQTNKPRLIAQYSDGITTLAYIADDICEVDYDLEDGGFNRTKYITMEE
jgi:hypothetical protein